MSTQDYSLFYIDEARRILFDINAIASCDAHEDYVYRTSKYTDEKLYGTATKMFEASDSYKLHTDIKEFHAAIDKILNDVSTDEECPWCKKPMMSSMLFLNLLYNLKPSYGVV